MRWDDIQLAQTGAAEDRHDVGDQLAEGGADAADKQRNQRHQHQAGAADAGQQDRRLLKAPIADAEQLLERLAARVFRRKQVLTGVLDQLNQQVEARQYDIAPHQLIADEPRQRHIAGQQRNSRDQHRETGDAVDQPGEHAIRSRRVIGCDQSLAHFADAQQHRADDRQHHNGNHAAPGHHDVAAHACGIGDLHQRHQHQQRAGEDSRIRLEGQRHWIGNRRQAPGWVRGGEQCAAEPGDQHAGIDDFLELFGEGFQHRRQCVVAGAGVEQQLQGDGGGDERRDS